MNAPFQHGCNVTTCPNGKCQQTGECQDKPHVASPPQHPAWMDDRLGLFQELADEAEAAEVKPYRVDSKPRTPVQILAHQLLSTPYHGTLPLPSDSVARKNVPMASGLLDYFPDALAEIAHVSYLGNEKHNPGERLHHARGKSMDHADCIIRHLTERGSRDPAGVRHSAQMAWRALALLQEELENELGLPLPRGARA